jgi:ADP-heptose:LPS heptosyltransferase
MWKTREWPAMHWTRLTHLLTNSGYEVVALGSHLDKERLETTFTRTYAFWGAQQEPEWIIDVMLGAEAVIGNDSGLTHLAGLLGIPTLALHAHLPPQTLWDCTEVVSLTPETNCVFCRWQWANGYNEDCDTACSALATISPDRVLRAFESLISARQTRKAAGA